MSAADAAPALGPLAGQEPLDAEAVGRQAAHDQRAEDRRRAGHGAHRLAGGGELRRQPGARVRDPRACPRR